MKLDWSWEWESNYDKWFFFFFFYEATNLRKKLFGQRRKDWHKQAFKKRRRAEIGEREKIRLRHHPQNQKKGTWRILYRGLKSDVIIFSLPFLREQKKKSLANDDNHWAAQMRKKGSASIGFCRLESRDLGRNGSGDNYGRSVKVDNKQEQGVKTQCDAQWGRYALQCIRLPDFFFFPSAVCRYNEWTCFFTSSQ